MAPTAIKLKRKPPGSRYPRFRASDATPIISGNLCAAAIRAFEVYFRSEAYTGARIIRCRDEELTHDARCPNDGRRGKLYDTKQPAIFIRLTGQPLVGATRYEQEALRCSACQERFTAPLPAGVKQDPLAGLQESVGAPLPESIQFERCEAVADAALPVFLYLRRLAADGEVIYSDDTLVKILSISFSSLRK